MFTYLMSYTSQIMGLTRAGLVIGLVYLIVWFITYWWSQRRVFKMGNKFPGPPVLPFLGNAGHFAGKTEDIFPKIAELMLSYGLIEPFRVWFGWTLYIIVCKPADVQIVLNKALQKGDVYRFSLPWTGHGLFTAPVSKWKGNRKTINPTFALKVLETFVPIFQAQNNILVQKLKPLSHLGVEFDIFEFVSPATLDIICETAMGTRLNAQEDHTYTDLAKRSLKIESERMYNIFYYPDWIFYRSKNGKEFMKGIKYFRDLTNVVIKRKRKEQEARTQKQNGIATSKPTNNTITQNGTTSLPNLPQNGTSSSQNLPQNGILNTQKSIANSETNTTTHVTQNGTQNGGLRTADFSTPHLENDYEHSNGTVSKKQRAFLDLLMEITQGDAEHWNDQQLNDEVSTMMIAGNDTTAAVVSFTLLMLGIHRDIQNEVLSELLEIFGTTDRDPEVSDLPRMDLLDRVVKETMRLYPVGPLIVRKCDKDIELEKHTIPSGSSIGIGIYGLHRNPEIWPEPNKFDPDRFLPELCEKRHPYAYIPFSAGPRNCIGIRYAKISFLMMLSTIIRNYEIICDYKIDDIQLQNDIMLKPSRGYLVKLKPRKLGEE